MKRHYSLLIVAAAFGLSAPAFSAVIITDTVENSAGWTNVSGGTWTTETGGLLPQAGTEFWTASIGSSQTRGLRKEFATTYAYGTTYIATFSVGDRSDLDFGGGVAYFFADTGGDGYQFTDVITTSGSRFQSGVDPVSGWQTWTLTTTILEGTTVTNGGAPVTDFDEIGFVFLFTTPSGLTSNRSTSFDNLSIKVAEPASAVLSINLVADVTYGAQNITTPQTFGMGDYDGNGTSTVTDTWNNLDYNDTPANAAFTPIAYLDLASSSGATQVDATVQHFGTAGVVLGSAWDNTAYKAGVTLGSQQGMTDLLNVTSVNSFSSSYDVIVYMGHAASFTAGTVTLNGTSVALTGTGSAGSQFAVFTGLSADTLTFNFNNTTPSELPNAANTAFTFGGIQIVASAAPPAVAPVIIGAVVNGSNEFVLDFTGAPSTNYEVKKSIDLGNFFSLAVPLVETTDGSGVGQATVPASEMGGAKQFFLLETAP